MSTREDPSQGPAASAASAEGRLEPRAARLAARETLENRGFAAGTTLLMVRHGESLANAERRFTKSDDEPLTEIGVEQALRTGRLLASHYRATALYSSPYRRAHHTAREIGRAFALEPQVQPLLHEQSFGSLEGRPYSEFFPRFAHVVGADRWQLAAPGGESLRRVADRVAPAVLEIACRHPGETVVVVSHGGVMAALRGWLLADFESPPVPTENADGYRLVVEAEGGCLIGPGPLVPAHL
jgi:broad specificity phosphatase PhoE